MKPVSERVDLWMAYLDGEMSASEAAAFDGTLSEVERGRAQGELRLEAALALRLSAPVVCPPATWGEVLEKIKGGKRRPWWQTQQPMRLAAAALVLLSAWGAALYVNRDAVRGQLARYGLVAPSPFYMGAASVAEMVALATVPAEAAEVQAFLDQAHVGTSLHASEMKQTSGRRTLVLRGAGMEAYGAGQAPVVYFECCGEPAKVIFLPKTQAGSGAEVLDEGTMDIIAAKEMGEYKAFVVSKHLHATRLLKLFDVAAQASVRRPQEFLHG